MVTRDRARELAIECVGLAEDVEEALDVNGDDAVRQAVTKAADLEGRARALLQELMRLERFLACRPYRGPDWAAFCEEAEP